MSLDVRLPIGLLFSLVGAVLAIFGLVSDPAIYRAHSLGVNVNLIWGAVMFAFGMVVLGLAALGRRGAERKIP